AHAGASPNPLQTGFAAIAQCTGAPIQVVLIETTNPYLSQGWRYYKIPPLPIAYRISLGPIFSAPRDEASARALVKQVESWFKKALQKSLS
ncbi:MAG: 1-acyl-sn-glycerol-3-phosphate acyltransferase, partial [Acetobacter sp.]|nr:1-acyl-sn-glycerol-3-phosphate acyltransferase [Acetobacter sp.]